MPLNAAPPGSLTRSRHAQGQILRMREREEALAITRAQRLTTAARREVQ